jgi:hypothetical protein
VENTKIYAEVLEAVAIEQLEWEANLQTGRFLN